VQPAVLIVDDHAGFRAAARALLEAAGYPVVGEAAGAAEAVTEAARLRPGLVLLDVQLPDGDGFDVAGVLAALPEPPIVLLVSVRDRQSYRRRLPGSAARGFIAKDRLTSAAVAALLT
jgi:two-component system nitrate/nitrite response regulator NarL